MHHHRLHGRAALIRAHWPRHLSLIITYPSHAYYYFALAAVVSATMLLNPAARFLSAAAFSVSRS